MMASGDGNRSPGLERQSQTYLAGSKGVKPVHPFSFYDLETQARASMDPIAWGYVEPGAGAGHTVDANQDAFLDYEIVPRVMRDVSTCDLQIDLFNKRIRSPLLLAPIGIQEIIHADAELASARAAASLIMPFILSSMSSRSIEEVAEAMGPMPRWFQLYWGARNDIALSFVERAERNGYDAIVVTVDAKLHGWRETDLQNGYMPILEGMGLANFFTDPEFARTLARPPREDLTAAVRHFVDISSNMSLGWDDLRWLIDQTPLPVLIKGVLHPDDAKSAIDHGVSGIVVSNHGGRQVDGAIGALRALPDVAAAADGRVPVLFDSGVRGGSHVVKALALGAVGVLIGRPYAYGLAINGEQGVRDVLLNILGDLDVTMRLCGFRSIEELSPECLRVV